MTQTFLTLLFVALSGPSETTLWHDLPTVDGLRVQDRDVPGIPYKALRITSVTHGDAHGDVTNLCETVLAEEGGRPSGRFKRREVLRDTATDRWVYEQVSVPILPDRDYVIHLWREQQHSPNHCAISFRVEDDPERPPVPGIVRISYSQGRWVVDRAGSEVDLSYEVISDPGEHLAPSLVRAGQRDAALEAVKAVLARAGQPARPN